MSVQINTNALRVAARKVDADSLAAMVTRINAAIDYRAQFESSDAQSWSKSVKKIRSNVDSVARLFVAANIEPMNVIARKLVSNAFFNAKALEKLVEIARFVDGGSRQMQVVSRAFIACAIVATEAGMVTIPNDVNQLFLKRSGVTANLVTDDDLRDKLQSLAREHCSNSDATQSSQMRCLLEVLNFVEIDNSNRARGGIKVNLKSPFIRLFRATYMVE